jgi:hypothetical protein
MEHKLYRYTYISDIYHKTYGKMSSEKLFSIINAKLSPVFQSDYLGYFFSWIQYWSNDYNRTYNEKVPRPPSLFGYDRSFAALHIKSIQENICQELEHLMQSSRYKSSDTIMQVELIAELVAKVNPPTKYGYAAPALIVIYILSLGEGEFCSRIY